MTPRERILDHRKRERMHVRSVQYCMRQGLYVEAFRSLAWALQQATAADAAARAENEAKIRKIQKVQRKGSSRP